MLNAIAILSRFMHTMPVKEDPSLKNVSFDNEEDLSETINAIDSSTLETVRNEVFAFEKRLMCAYSMLDTLPETELKLPMLLIDNFSTIFRLWKENRAFKNSVSSTVFYDIFSLMFRSFNDEADDNEQTENSQDDAHPSNLTAICDICDEEFEIIENDAKKSLAEHELTEAHIETSNLLSKIGTSEGKADDFKSMTQPVARTVSLLDTNVKLSRRCVNVIEKNDIFLKWISENYIECYLCDVSTNRGDLLNHCNSQVHKKRRFNFFTRPPLTSKQQAEFYSDLIFTMRNSIYCVLCRWVSIKQDRNMHAMSECHKRWLSFARGVVKLEEPYFYEIDRKSRIAYCELCNVKFSVWNSVVPHCQTKNHITYKHFADEIQFLYQNRALFRN